MPLKDPELKRAYQKAYWKKNQSKLSADRKRWYEENHDQRLVKQKIYREENAEKVRAGKKYYYLRNRERILGQYRRNRQGPGYEAKNLRWLLWRLYKITVEEYEALLEEQGGVCAVCREKCKARKRLAVDHDHETRAVRGLLCARCNTALGMLLDDLNRVEALAEYLRKYLKSKAA